jgi:regulator of protease activity HflC (stomatin/prohibitin superfamily)
MKKTVKKIRLLYPRFKSGITTYLHRHSLGITLTLLIFVFFVALFWRRIVIPLDSGEQGIRWSFINGTKLDEYYGEGVHCIWPWDKMYIYTTRIQTKNDSMQILTTEGLSVYIEFTYRFKAMTDSIPVIHKTLGIDYAEKIVGPEVKSAAMSIIGNYTPQQLYKISTLVIQSTIKYYLSKQMIEKNIIVDDYLIKRIALPTLISQAIEKKLVAEQLNYEFDYRLKVEEKEKQRKSIEAEGIRQFENISKLSILKWKGLEVTSDFAKSQNSKIIIMGTDQKSLPLLLNTDEKK